MKRVLSLVAKPAALRGLASNGRPLYKKRPLSVVQPAIYGVKGDAQFSTLSIAKVDDAALLRSGNNKLRSFSCAEVGTANFDEDVTICGWLQSSRLFKNVLFIVVRDESAIVQAVISKESPFFETAKELRLESVVRVQGKVSPRPDDMVNPHMLTGDRELDVNNFAVVNKAEQLPIDLHGIGSMSEEKRLRHRFLDLRRVVLQRNLRLRSILTNAARRSLLESGFVEVETPTLFKSTPEGAREFLVPTRNPNHFYALIQSPQQYKQMLMASGFEKYFQVARCYRDEGGRADRQPEFTQIDLEMAFSDAQAIQETVERMICTIWDATAGYKTPEGLGVLESLPLTSVTPPFPRMKYKEAMGRFGSDKPDTRFGLELIDVSAHFKGTSIQFLREVLDTRGSVRAFNATKLASKNFSRKIVKDLEDEAKQLGGSAMIVQIQEGGLWRHPVAKHLRPEEMAAVSESLGAAAGDVLVIAAGQREQPLNVLGRLRLICAELLVERQLLVIPAADYNFLWIEDFPLFELDEEQSRIIATHHPFTAPVPEDVPVLIELIDEISKGAPIEGVTDALLSIRGQHYDLVCNGWEVGGGSIRIHQAQLQRDVLKKILDVGDSQTASFSHLLEALSSGCPPHGGIALGLDRLTALLCKALSLRDVIAFPKSTAGRELLTGSPSQILPEQLAEYHICTRNIGQQEDLLSFQG